MEDPSQHLNPNVRGDDTSPNRQLLGSPNLKNGSGVPGLAKKSTIGSLDD